MSNEQKSDLFSINREKITSIIFHLCFKKEEAV